jgi:hypothetical protein
MASYSSRPPFATDLPDSAYAQPQPQPRYRQPPRDDPNARTSAYNQCVRFVPSSFRVIYPSLVATMRTWMVRVSKADMSGRQRGIHYGIADNGTSGAYNGHAAPASVAHVAQPVPQQMPVPLAAPRPGYAAPIAALNQSSSLNSPRFPPGIEPALAHSNQHGAPRMPPPALRLAHPPASPITVPSTPHPLPPTMTPILPVFARPSQHIEPHDVKWGPEPILRGNSEEKLLPRRGEKGDDFWRRFSMVAREESRKPCAQKQRYEYSCATVTTTYLVDIDT